LDVKVLDENDEEIDLKQTFEDDDDIIPQPVSDAEDMDDSLIADGDLDSGFSIEDIDGDDYDDFDDDGEDEDDEDGDEDFSFGDDSDEDLI
ncbi:MAG: AAA family ATPase, partial [Clostridia bacterium]|nr:AAA family ATPase [Clostridia bacterium]